MRSRSKLERLIEHFFIYRVLVNIIVIGLFLTAPVLSFAQILEEVIVSAQKREQSLQDVPISITTMSGEDILSVGIEGMDSLSPLVPNFHYSESVSGNDQVLMRGLGAGTNFGFEMAVGLVIDGFFFGRSRYNRAAFLDLERVEVLKGPQGALIGKNTSAGAINITTAKPKDEFEAWISPKYEFTGNEGYSIEGAISGPLTDTLKARLAVRYDDRDGWIENTATNNDEQTSDDITARGTLVWEPTDTLDITLQYLYSDSEKDGRSMQFSHCTPATLAFIQALPPFLQDGEDCKANLKRSGVGPRNGVGDFQEFTLDIDSVGLTVNWDIGGHTLTSLTGYSAYDASDIFEGDTLSLEVIAADAGDDWEQWMQELRLSSQGENQFDYIAGFFYMHTEQKSFLDIHFAFGLPPAFLANRHIETEQEGDTVAVFGQFTWHINDEWDATVGGRYTREEKDARSIQFPAALYTQNQIFLPPGPFPTVGTHDISESRTENNFSPSFNVQWRPHDDMMYYGSVSRGFKGGGFDHQLTGNQALVAGNFQFQEEEVTAYEIGSKLVLDDGAAQVNLAVFRSEFDDLQVAILGQAVTFNIKNAASVITQGVEADFRWRPLDDLTLSGTMAYLDASYDQFKNAPCHSLQTVAQGCVAGIQDLTDKDLTFAPEWTITIGGEYVWHLPNNLNLVGFLQANYLDNHAMQTDLEPFGFQESYVKINGRLALRSPDGKWEVALVGRNLTNAITSSFSNDAQLGPFAVGSQFELVEFPRSVSLQGIWRF